MTKDYYAEGYAAFEAGKTDDANPYVGLDSLHPATEWAFGYADARLDGAGSDHDCEGGF